LSKQTRTELDKVDKVYFNGIRNKIYTGV
jgi:hypothetical protein